MDAKFFFLAIVGIVIAFFGGFYVANSLNGREFARLQAENEQLKKNPNNVVAQQPAEDTLSDDEITKRIAEADKNPGDTAFQKNLGMALLTYGVSKQRTELIGESTRLLKRAFAADPKDLNVIIALGNAYYDLASLKNDNESFTEARQYYAKALEIKPDDANVRADYGSTFVFGEPPDYERGNAELSKALAQEPKNQRAMLLMAQSLLKQDKTPEAEKFLTELKSINPQAPSLAELKTEMARDRKSSTK